MDKRRSTKLVYGPLGEEKMEELIKILKEIQGTNVTQIARIIRVSRRLVEKHWC